jgi:hypothetical protein
MTEKELKEKIFEINDELNAEKAFRQNEKIMNETLRQQNYAYKEYIATLEKVNEEYLIKIAKLKIKIDKLINDINK